MRRLARLSVAFDALSGIVAKFGLQAVFGFPHLLASRLDAAEALPQCYVDPRTENGATLDVL